MDRDSVATPLYIKEALEREFNTTFFDPCPLNPHWTIDGLSIPWKPFTFVNPPYSNVRPWLEKAAREHKLGNTVILLLKTETVCRRYFKQFEGVELRFINHRIKFPLYPLPARFSSMLVVFRTQKVGYSIVDYRVVT